MSDGGKQSLATSRKPSRSRIRRRSQLCPISDDPVRARRLMIEMSRRFTAGPAKRCWVIILRNTVPMLASPRCGANTRSGKPCRSPAVGGKARCRMRHGGAPGSGAPRGNKNAVKSGQYTGEAIEQRRTLQALLRHPRTLIRKDRTVILDRRCSPSALIGFVLCKSRGNGSPYSSEGRWHICGDQPHKLFISAPSGRRRARSRTPGPPPFSSMNLHLPP